MEYTRIKEEERLAAEHRFNKFFIEHNLEAKSIPAAPHNVEDIPVIVNGGAAKWIVPVALGVAGFFTAGATWAAIPAALTAFAAGMQLMAGLEDQGSRKEKRRAPTYTFSMGGSDDELAKQGDTIPIVYCNAIVNPKGGVRWSGKMVAARVVNQADSGYLIQVLALSLGRIGSLNTSKTLINNQPISQFFPEDFTFEFLPGSPSFYTGGTQGGFSNDEFNFLGHVTSPSSFDQIGVNLRALSANDSATAINSSISGWTTTNSFQNGNNITKNSGTEGVYDAFALTSEAIGDGGGSFSVKLINSNQFNFGFGYGLNDVIDYSVNIVPGGIITLTVGDTTYTEDLAMMPFTWSINDVWEVDLTFDVNDNKVVNFVQNSVTVFSVQNNWDTQRAKVVMAQRNSPVQLEGVQGFFAPTSSNSFDVGLQGGEMIISVYEDDKTSIANYEKFTPAELYVTQGQEFRVIQKLPVVPGNGNLVQNDSFFTYQLGSFINNDRNKLRCIPAIPIGDEDDIYAKWEAYYQTLRRCTDITVNFNCVIFSREKPEREGGGGKK